MTEYRKNFTRIRGVITSVIVFVIVLLGTLFLIVGMMWIMIGDLSKGGEKPHKIYFDNGFENNFNIYIDGNIIESIGPKEIKIINITSGTHKIDIKNDTGEFFESNNITLGIWDYKSPQYIYNIGRKYFYYIEICKYGVKPENIKEYTKEELEIGNETIIEYSSRIIDIDESCPDTMSVLKETNYAIIKKITRRIDKK